MPTTDRKFRFSVVAALAPNAQAWTAQARRAEDLGYSTLLMPDTTNTFEPFTGLAAAAVATSTLRVGTFVLPAPFYTPSEVAWKSLTLDVVSGGRFDLGLGAGRPDAEQEVGQRERAFGSAAERVGQLRTMIRDVKREFADATANQRAVLRPVQSPHPPILLAASAPKMFELAAQEADMVTLGLPPTTDEDGLAAKARQLADIAGERFDRLEVSINLAAVGEEVPDWLEYQVGADPRELIASGAMSILTGTTDEMVDKLRRRRDTLGISSVSVSGAFLDKLAPVVEILAGT
jgi:probable F420-dependent oxidoreductase